MIRPLLMSRRSAFLQIALVAVVLIAAVPALFQNNQTASAAQTATTTANLRLRIGPTTASDTILVMPVGSPVEVTGAVIDGFYPVIYQDTAGYAYGSYLRLDAPSPGSGQVVRINTALHLRAGPATTFASLAIMPAGANAVLTGQISGVFYELTYNSMLGWAHSAYFTLVADPPLPGPSATSAPPTLTPTATASPAQTATATPGGAPGGDTTSTPTPSPTATTGPAETATVLARLNLRAGAGTNFPVITIMPQGAIVTLLGESTSGFEKVRFGAYEGWAYASYLDIQGGSTSPDNTAKTTTSLNLRSGAGSGFPVILVMPANATVTITGGLQNNYLPVVYQGQAGWAFAAYLSGSMVPLPSTPPQLNVIMYHRVGSTFSDYQVTTTRLDQQLAWLKSNGYVSITPRDLLAWLNNGTPLPPKPVMITIDDGHPSNRTFKQLLDAYGFKGTWFIPNFTALTAAELRTYHASGEVCGHTVTHPQLSLYSYAGQWAEVYNNKVWLDGILGESITCFSYPYGDYNSTTVRVVQDAGYRIAFNAWGGTQVLSPSMNRWHVVRWNVYGHYTLTDFIRFMG